MITSITTAAEPVAVFSGTPQSGTDPLHIQDGVILITAPAVIDTPGRYLLTNDLVNSTAGTAIQITASDVILDGGGHTLSGSDNDNTGGIFCSNDTVVLTNITISNLTLSHWDLGITLDTVSESLLTGVNARENRVPELGSGQGFAIADCINITIENCTSIDNSIGFALGYSTGCRLLNCTARENDRMYGVSLIGCQNTVMRDCLMEENMYNLQVSLQYSQDIDTSNTVDGKPVFYLSGVKDMQIGPADNPGTVFCVDCSNITVEGISISRCGMGIGFIRTDLSSIKDCSVDRSEWGIGLIGAYDTGITNTTISSCHYGVNIDAGSENTTLLGSTVEENDVGVFVTGFSSGNIIRDNHAMRNRENGIWLGKGDENSIVSENQIYENQGSGIYIEDNTGVIIKNNTLEGNSMSGIGAFGATGPILLNNTIKNSNYGVFLYETTATEVSGNTIAENGNAGIQIHSTNDSLFYNNLFNNTVNVHIDQEGAPSTWNITKSPGPNIVSGPYIGGNYWADPDGTGWSQTHPDRGDGFCNASFVFDANNTDYLPLHLTTSSSNVGVFRDGVFYRKDATDIVYGLSTDTPVIGDWNGDGMSEVGVFRGGVFYRNGATDIVYGLSTDTPIVGDWNGDGVSEVGVYRGGVFYRNGADVIVYGLSTDTPVIGDWNGDHISDVGVYRDGVFYRNGAEAIVYGLSTDTPVIGDWNGDGISEVGVYRGGVFYRNGADAIVYGLSTDTPVIGKWT